MEITVVNSITKQRFKIDDSQKEAWINSTTPWILNTETLVTSLPRPRQKVSEDKHKGIQEVISHIFACLRAIALARRLNLEKEKQDCNSLKQLVSQLTNSNYAFAILEWCKIFGTNSEATHWKRILGEGFSLSDLLEFCETMSEDEYRALHSRVTTLRKKYVAHNEYSYEGKLIVPDMDLVVVTCKALFKTISRLVTQARGEDGSFFKMEVADIDMWYENLQENVDKLIGNII